MAGIEEGWQEWFSLADEALYRAKNQGRDTPVLADWRAPGGAWRAGDPHGTAGANQPVACSRVPWTLASRCALDVPLLLPWCVPPIRRDRLPGVRAARRTVRGIS